MTETKNQQNAGDEDSGKGAVEQDRPSQKTNVSATGQQGHRDQDPRLQSSGSDFPEPGQNEEHTGEPRATNLNGDFEVNPDASEQNASPGARQKENQNQRKDDPLAS